MLTHETIQAIGGLLGMPYVVFDGYNIIPDDASDGEVCMSGKATIIKGIGKIPSLLIFTGLVSSHQYDSYGKNDTQSIYVLNLSTLNPTKKSYRQTEIPLELKKRVRYEINSYLRLN